MAIGVPEMERALRNTAAHVLMGLSCAFGAAGVAGVEVGAFFVWFPLAMGVAGVLLFLYAVTLGDTPLLAGILALVLSGAAIAVGVDKRSDAVDIGDAVDSTGMVLVALI